MFLAVGSGAYVAAIFHMITHAFFKALLFLGSGLGDPRHARRAGHAPHGRAAQAACRSPRPRSSSAGWPSPVCRRSPASGSKDEILLFALAQEPRSLYVVGLVTALLTAYYMTRQVIMVFYGEARWKDAAPRSTAPTATSQPHESPSIMLFPLVVLAGLVDRRRRSSSCPFTTDLQLRSSTGSSRSSRSARPTSPTPGLRQQVAVLAVVAIVVAARRHRRRRTLVYVEEEASRRSSRRSSRRAGTTTRRSARSWAARAGRRSTASPGSTRTSSTVPSTAPAAACAARPAQVRKAQSGYVRNYAARRSASASCCCSCWFVVGPGGPLMHRVRSRSSPTLDRSCRPSARCVVTLLSKRRPELRQAHGASLVSVVTGAHVSIWLLVGFETGDAGFQFVSKHPWIEQWGISWHLGVDGISLFLVVLTGRAVPARHPRRRPAPRRTSRYLAWLLLLEAGVMGSFLSLDLFLFFVFFEIVLVPMYFLIGGWGYDDRVYAATKFFLLHDDRLGVHARRHHRHRVPRQRQRRRQITFDLVEIAEQANFAATTGRWLFFAFAVAFAVKVPMFPLHTWLPDAHTQAPTAGSVILAGVMLKLGTYGLLRFGLYLFPEAARWSRAAVPHARRHRHHLRRHRGDDAEGPQAARRLLVGRPPRLHRARHVRAHVAGDHRRRAADDQPRHVAPARCSSSSA